MQLTTYITLRVKLKRDTYHVPASIALFICHQLFLISLAVLTSLFLFTGQLFASQKVTVIAVVNGEPITSLDLTSRVDFIGKVTGLRVNDSTIADIRRDALQNLIDEKIKIQQGLKDFPSLQSAARRKARELVDKNFAKNGLSGQQALKTLGVRAKTIREKFYADLLWTNVISSRFARQFQNLDEIAEQERSRIKSSMQEPQVKVSEIALLPTQKRSVEQTIELANRIVDAVRKGANFAAIAQQYSSAGSATKGGKVGWIFVSRLPEAVQNALKTTKTGDITSPIADRTQVIILRKEGERADGLLDPKTTKLSLSRAIMPLDISASANDKREAAASLKQKTEALKSCAQIEALNDTLGSDIPSFLGTFQLGTLSPQLQKIMLPLQAGELSQPIAFTEGLVVFMVCERINPNVAIPDIETLKGTQVDKLMASLGGRYLMRLQRNAVIEYRE